MRLHLNTSSVPDESDSGRANQSILQTVQQLRGRWKDGAFVAGWELQSHVSSIVLVGFARFGSVNAAIPVMLLWALLSTLAFHHARLAGRPDLLEHTSWGTHSHAWHVRAMSMCWSVLKAWLAGIQAFLYARVFGCVLRNEGRCLRQRLTKITVLGFGLTIFGVPTAHHLLRKAGFERAALLRLGFVATFLNVPFRVIASAFVINFTASLIDVPLV
jgi:hypothetical protein